jgi:hypothetical protein
MRSLRLLPALLLLAACSKKPEPAPAAVTPAPPPAVAPFTMRDLAAATALDARLARFSLAAADAQAALPAQEAAPVAAKGERAAAPSRERAKALLPGVETALAEAEAAQGAIAHPLDRQQAERAVAAARTFAGKLAAAVAAAAPGAQAELFAARDALGSAILGYRAARSAWRLDAPEPTGVERDFAEARRELERVETAFGSRTRVAPREEGHEFDAAAARMTGQMAARRAKAAADQLAPELKAPAVRHAEAQERAVEAMISLRSAPEAERAALSRGYHAAKAEALGALADYFAALAAR